MAAYKGDEVFYESSAAKLDGTSDLLAEVTNYDPDSLVPEWPASWTLATATYRTHSDNVTTPPPGPPTFNDLSIIRTVVLSLMFVFSFLGNTATLVQVYRRRKSTINLLILHLATADLVVTFFCNVTDAVWASTIQWYAGTVMCKLLKFLQVFGLYLSTYIIVIISLNRCCAILDPMSRNKSPKRVRTMIIIAWLCSILFALPQTYVFSVKRGPWKEDFYQCVTHGTYTADWQEQLYSCLSALLMFILPLIAMVTAYMLIFCTIAKKSRDLQREVESVNTEMLSRGPVRAQLFRKAKVKSLRMTALIVVAFIVCWTPYYVLFIILVFMGKDWVNEKYVLWIFFFGMANSMVNPMIYGAFQLCRKRRRIPFPEQLIQRKVQAPDVTSSSSAQTQSSGSSHQKRNTSSYYGHAQTPLMKTTGKTPVVYWFGSS